MNLNLPINKLKNIEKAIIIFFILFPFLLISGPFLPDLTISIISICFLFFLKKNYKIFDYNYTITAIFLFYIYINFNSLFSDYPEISFQSSLPYLRIIFFSLFLAYALIKIEFLSKIILFSFALAFVILFIDSLYQIIFGQNIIGFKLHPSNRVSSFFGEELIMGSFVSKILPLIIAISFVIDFKNKKIFQIIILLISGSLVYFSNERSAGLHYLFILLIYLLVSFEKKNFYIFLILIVSFSFVIYKIKPDSIQRLYYATKQQLSETRNIFYPSYRHQLHYLTAYNIFKKNKILGTGIKSFRYNCSKNLYSVSEKIENDNIVYSSVSGYFFIKYLYLNGTMVKHIYITKNIENNFSLSSNPTYRVFGDFLKLYKNDGDYVKSGDKLYSSHEYKNGCNTHPHNIYLQFMSELGIIGFCFLAILFFFVVIQILVCIKKIIFESILKKEINNHCYKLFILLAVFLFMFPLLPSGNFFNNWYSIIFSFQFGFFIHLLYLKK